MKCYQIIIVAIAVLTLAFTLTAMADPPPRESPATQTAVSSGNYQNDALAVRPVVPDEGTDSGSNKKIKDKSKFKEIKDFHKSLKPLDDAAKKGNIKKVRSSVNVLIQRSNALSKCKLPSNTNRKEFIKARKALQKSVRTLGKSCKKQSDERVAADLNTVNQRYQQLEALTQ